MGYSRNYNEPKLLTPVSEMERTHPTITGTSEKIISQFHNGKRKTEEEQTHNNSLKSQKTYGVACIEVLSKDYFHVYMKELEEILSRDAIIFSFSRQIRPLSSEKLMPSNHNTIAMVSADKNQTTSVRLSNFFSLKDFIATFHHDDVITPNDTNTF
ncbi:hypothetical protein YC2023_010836 [Brassica napus]